MKLFTMHSSTSLFNMYPIPLAFGVRLSLILMNGLRSPVSGNHVYLNGKREEGEEIQLSLCRLRNGGLLNFGMSIKGHFAPTYVLDVTGTKKRRSSHG